MVIIRKEQIEALGKYMLKNYIERSLATVEERFSEQTSHMDRSELRDMIHGCIQKAKQFQINMETDVDQFLEYNIIYGIDFYVKPEFAQAMDILNKDIDGTAKMILLSELMDPIEKETT